MGLMPHAGLRDSWTPSIIAANKDACVCGVAPAMTLAVVQMEISTRELWRHRKSTREPELAPPPASVPTLSRALVRVEQLRSG